MSVANLIEFVGLCRAFGVDASPSQSAALVADFTRLDAGDRALLEEAAVGSLARDSESEAVVRRLFGLCFGGETPPAPAAGRPKAAAELPAVAGGDPPTTAPGEPIAADPPPDRPPQHAARPVPPRPAHPRPAGAALSAAQMQALLEALEALANAVDVGADANAEPGRTPPRAGLPQQLFADAAQALQALRPLDGRARRPEAGGDPGAAERLLREMARRPRATRGRDGRAQRDGGALPPLGAGNSDAAGSDSSPAEGAGESDSQERGERSQGNEAQNGQEQGGEVGRGNNGQGGRAEDGQGQDGDGLGGQGQGSGGQGGRARSDGCEQDGRGGDARDLGPETGGSADGGRALDPDGWGQRNGQARAPSRGLGGGRGRGVGGAGSPLAEAAAQRLGAACTALLAAGSVASAEAARLAAALEPRLARAFTAQLTAALRAGPGPQKRERLESALEAIAGHLMAGGDLSPRDAVRLLSAADERLRAQTLVAGAGLRSLLHDAEALADLLHRYRRRRDLLPVLVARLADALRRLLTRPSPVMARSDAGRLDFRATMRESLAYGGVPLEFRYRRRRQEHEIVLALDTSGSQRAWAASAVLSAYALGRLLPRLRAFSFSSDIVEVTRYLPKPDRFVERLEDFAGFSNYQTALTQLEAAGVLSRRTTLILVGDCRDAQGRWSKEKEGRYQRFLDPESAAVMRRLVKRCRRVVVLNSEEQSRWASGDSAAQHYDAAGATVLHVSSPIHLAEQLARLSLGRR